MAIPKITGAQRDFSAGEVDATLKRQDEHPVFKSGLRQCSNFRILSARKLANRFGRSVKFIGGPRVDEVLMAAGQIFYLVFGNGFLQVFNAAGVGVFGQTVKGDGTTPIPWTTVTAKNIRWVASGLLIYITYADGAPNNVPQVLTWDGVSQVSTWTLSTYAEEVIGNQKRTPFYRFAASLGITIGATGLTGSIQLNLSANYWVAGHVGTRIRYVGRQCLITSVVTPLQVNATVEEPLPGAQTLVFSVDPATVFSVGDVCTGTVTGTKGIVLVVSSGPKTVQFQLTSTSTTTIVGQFGQPFVAAFTASDTVVGPGGALAVASVSTIGVPGVGQPVWDEEVMNAFRGYPSSVFFDQARLGFCNFSSVPSGIVWSSISVPTDLYTVAQPSGSIFSLVPDKSQVFDVAAGMQSSEFVFCDTAVHEIPINQTNPLSGAVGPAFNKISDDGCANVQPRRMQNVLIYINAGGRVVRAIMTTGAYYRANESRDISELHTHLINNPIAIACPTANDPNYSERYFYILNSDGSIAVGRVDVQDGQVKIGTVPGWTPWSGVGAVQWISARAANIMFTTTYSPGGVTPVTVAELLDPNQYLDGAILYNSPPPAMAAPPTLGPLWWLRDSLSRGTVFVMDQGTRQMGVYNIDPNGFLIPQNFAGENFASSQLMVGQAWTATAEPFTPDANPGQSVHQRMFRRRISRMAVYVSNSTGFLMARLFSGPLSRTSPALGTIMNQFRVTTYNQDDDPTQPPPLREEAQRWRPLGRAFDPRVAVIKDTPGPLTIEEIGLEASI